MVIAIAVVAIALATGTMLTVVLVHRYAGTVPLRSPAEAGRQAA
jgi:hypothetical protein